MFCIGRIGIMGVVGRQNSGSYGGKKDGLGRGLSKYSLMCAFVMKCVRIGVMKKCGSHPKEREGEGVSIQTPTLLVCRERFEACGEKKGGGAVSKWCWRAERRHRAFEMSAAADFGASMPAFFSQIRAPWDPGEQRETCTVTAAAGMWTTSHTEAKDEPAPCLLILLGFFSLLLLSPSLLHQLDAAWSRLVMMHWWGLSVFTPDLTFLLGDVNSSYWARSFFFFFFFPFCSPTLRQ